MNVLTFLLSLLIVAFAGASSYAYAVSSNARIYDVFLINTAVILGGSLVGYIFIPVLREVDVPTLILILSSWATSLWGGISGALNRMQEMEGG
jgi:hypothetical protein